MTKSGLCLSGGGSKGAFELGVLEYVSEHPDLYPEGFACGSGCSVGAIGMGSLAMFKPGPGQLRSYVAHLALGWEGLTRTSDVWVLKFPPFLAGLWNPSIGDNTPLRKYLKTLIDFDATRVGTPCEVAAWDMLAGRTVYLSLQDAGNLDELVSYILASASFPIALPPEQVGSAYCTDGGITSIAPADRLIKAGCDRILAVICQNPDHPEVIQKKDLGNVIRVGLRCLDGMEGEVVRGDLERVRLWNFLVEAGHPAAEGKRKIGLDVIMPPKPLGDPLIFSPELTAERRKIGYETAKSYFESGV